MSIKFVELLSMAGLVHLTSQNSMTFHDPLKNSIT